MPLDPSKPARFWTNPRSWHAGFDRGSPRRQSVKDVAFVQALLDDLATRFPVDPRRVFVTGFSNGAALAFRLGTELSERFAALAPVAGHCWLEDPKPLTPRPTLYLIGTEDPLVPVQGGEVTTPWGNVVHQPPVQQSLARWAQALACPPQPTVLREENGVRVVVFGPGPSGAELRVYLIEGLGHHWPGGKSQLAEAIAGKPSRKVNATEVIWEFFQAHPSNQ